jgi:AmmeMemoRadiSam system protein A
MNLTTQSGDFLIRLAGRAIMCGFDAAHAPAPDLGDCPPQLLAHRACFVTLSTPESGLRGCRGMLHARRSLAADVWYNAFASAFDDPRFSPVVREEIGRLEIDVSVLGPLEPIRVSGEQELFDTLERRRDGLVLEWRGRRATFLPKVWESLPEPADFLRQLKLKAGLPAGFWAPDVQVYRYQVAVFQGGLG